MLKHLLTTLLGSTLALGGVLIAEQPAPTVSLATIEAEKIQDYETLTTAPTFVVTEKTKASLPQYLLDQTIAGYRPVVDVGTRPTSEVAAACAKVLTSLGVNVANLLKGNKPVVCEQEIRVAGKERGLTVNALKK